MIKVLLAAAATLALGACAGGDMMRLGGCPWLALGEVPSGCQVRGYGNYYMAPGSYDVVQIANRKAPSEMLRTARDAVDSPGPGGPSSK
jgi:hypothetical protein